MALYHNPLKTPQASTRDEVLNARVRMCLFVFMCVSVTKVAENLSTKWSHLNAFCLATRRHNAMLHTNFPWWYFSHFGCRYTWWNIHIALHIINLAIFLLSMFFFSLQLFYKRICGFAVPQKIKVNITTLWIFSFKCETVTCLSSVFFIYKRRCFILIFHWVEY